MPEHLRALFVITVLAAAVFFTVERAKVTFAGAQDLKRWRNLWFALTFAAFLCQDFWLYVLTASVLILLWSAHSQNKPGLFLLLLFIIPAASMQVPGFGLINYIFQLNQPRLLALLLLLPCLLSVKGLAGNGGKISDRLFLSYVLLAIILQFRQTTVTDTARFGFHIFLDAVLPYFVFSRALKDMHAFRQALLCFVLACAVMAVIAMFEFGKHWLLYSTVTRALGLGYDGTYLGRADLLRASGPTGHPIILGYVMMIAIGFYLFFMNHIGSNILRRLGLAALAGGLIAALSRGPWLGTIMLIAVFAMTGQKPARNLIGLGFAGAIGLAALFVIPGGEKILNLLPYLGTVDTYNIEYRERLFNNALIVIQRNFWFGSVNYLETPEMQEMMQGQGIVDVVNSYIGIALALGIVGLTLFVLFFASTVMGVWRAMASVKLRSSDEYKLGRSLLATAIAVLFTIATVSSIANIPIIYWSIAGMCVAYARMIRNSTTEAGNSGKTKPSIGI